MVGTDRASGSGLDLQNYARYQNRSGVSRFLCLHCTLFGCRRSVQRFAIALNNIFNIPKKKAYQKIKKSISSFRLIEVVAAALFYLKIYQKWVFTV